MKRSKGIALVAISVGFLVATSACSQAKDASKAGITCSDYQAQDFMKQSNSLSDLLMANRINPAAAHHYEGPSGSNMMNQTNASLEINDFCKIAGNGGKDISSAISWNTYKKAN